jgi:sugar/nucleoside kinase (ribokinase family)
MAPGVLVVGDVINDILVEAAGPIEAGEDNPAAIRARPGGSAANQAAWLGWMGAEVTFAGRAGAADAQFHRAELARFGVRAHLAADEVAPTGSIVVLVGAGSERTFLTDRGANLRLTSADVPAALLDDAALLHLTGYTLFEPGPREVALGLIARARSRGIPFSVDPGSAAFLASLAPGEFVGWTAGAVACFPNRDEAAVLTGPDRMPQDPAGPGPPAGLQAVGQAGTGPAITDPLAMAAMLTSHYGAVALKLGAEGALLATAGAEPRRFPARQATVRDTTGAGDAFCAGFIAAWLGCSPAWAWPRAAGMEPSRGISSAAALSAAALSAAALPAAMDAGSRAAAIAVSALGGRPGSGRPSPLQ